MMANEIENLICTWLKEFYQKLKQRSIKPECLCNADQTCLYYQKLRNTLYVDIKEKKNTCRFKQMNYNTRVTLMMCTSINGDKINSAVYGEIEEFSLFCRSFLHTSK